MLVNLVLAYTSRIIYLTLLGDVPGFPISIIPTLYIRSYVCNKKILDRSFIIYTLRFIHIILCFNNHNIKEKL